MELQSPGIMEESTNQSGNKKALERRAVRKERTVQSSLGKHGQADPLRSADQSQIMREQTEN